MLRACAVSGVIVGAAILCSCHRARLARSEDSCQTRTYGESSVEFAAADTREPRPTGTSMDRVVIEVREGTAERASIADAQVLLIAGVGADSGRLVLGRQTLRNGTVILDSLAARRYEVTVRRIGYETARQGVTVRSGFADTVRFALRGVVVCLVE